MKPVPEGKWAWEYDACIKCKTTEIRHKGRGLCLRCHDKERSKSPRRKLQRLMANRRYKKRNQWKESFKKSNREKTKKHYNKNKDDPEFRERIRQYNRDAYNRNKDSTEFKKLLKARCRRHRLKIYFRKFLQGDEFYLKKYQGGVKIVCDGCSEHCQIVSPVEIGPGKASMNELSLFKKLVIQDCNKK